MAEPKKLMRALNGETQAVPPVWMMRQAGRYLPEYRETRAKAGDFLSLCYNPDLATEVTMQPIRRYGFDAAILFADILLVPQALGVDLTFVQGEGPRLSTVTTEADLAALKSTQDIHDTLSPVYQTVVNLTESLPDDVALIGFAGAPWTVATYMIAGQGTPDQAPAHALKDENRVLFQQLLLKITDATIEYLHTQIMAGAEVVMLFDSWAGSLKGADFAAYSLAPTRHIISTLRKLHPDIPVIAFPRQGGDGVVGFANATGANCIALDYSVDAQWAVENVQRDSCVMGNLDPAHMVTGGQPLIDEVRRIRDVFSGGPHIFNLGHGITPDADPDNVQLMLDTLRENA